MNGICESSANKIIKNPKLKKEIVVISTLIPLVCAKKTYDEYKKTPDKDKKQLILKNSLVSAGAFCGLLIGKKQEIKLAEIIKDLPKKETIKKLGYTFLHDSCVPFFCILSGFIVSHLIKKPQEPEKQVKTTDKLPNNQTIDLNENKIIQKPNTPTDWLKNVSNRVDGEVFHKIANGCFDQLTNVYPKKIAELDVDTLAMLSNYAGLSLGSSLYDYSSSMNGFVAGSAATPKDKVIQMAKQLTFGLALPVALGIPVSIGLNKIIKEDKKVLLNIAKASVIMPISYLSNLITNKVSETFEKQHKMYKKQNNNINAIQSASL